MLDYVEGWNSFLELGEFQKNSLNTVWGYVILIGLMFGVIYVPKLGVRLGTTQIYPKGLY
jgi:hypothetical protein